MAHPNNFIYVPISFCSQKNYETWYAKEDGVNSNYFIKERLKYLALLGQKKISFMFLKEGNRESMLSNLRSGRSAEVCHEVLSISCFFFLPVILLWYSNSKFITIYFIIISVQIAQRLSDLINAYFGRKLRTDV